MTNESRALATVVILVLAGCGGDSFGSSSKPSSSASDADAPVDDAGSGAGGRLIKPGADGGATGIRTGTGGAGEAGVGAGTGGVEVGGAGGAEHQDGGDAGGAAAGGAVGAGGAGGTTSTGGSSSGGTNSGGATSTGGVTGAGGSTCTPVTHDNGAGKTWQDCVPLDTYNMEQAMKACQASYLSCVESCGACVNLGGAYACWGISGSVAGHVYMTSALCAAGTVGSAWH